MNLARLIISLLLANTLISACKNTTDAKVEITAAAEKKVNDEVVLTNDQYKIVGIETGHIVSRSLSNVIKANGSFDVEPSHMATVSAPLGGYVRSAGLLPGQPVKKGQVIAVIENQEFINLQQEYLEGKARLEYLELEYKRQEELRKEDINAAKTFQQVTADLNTMKARINGLEQKLALIGINKNNLQPGKISRTANLYAPISGNITGSNVNIGKYVVPSDVLFEIANKEDIHLAIDVFEKDVTAIKPGQNVRFSLANETGYNRKATVYLIGKATGTGGVVPVHCHLVNNKDQNLLPGMYIKAVIEIGSNPVNALPVKAIVQSEGKDYIFIETGQQKDGRKFKMIPVKKGIEEDGYVEVILPDNFDINATQVVTKEAYSILSAIKNVEE
jgi:cobalt-zinc-cadmium efflux system membrane fusion protein